MKKKLKETETALSKWQRKWLDLEDDMNRNVVYEEN